MIQYPILSLHRVLTHELSSKYSINAREFIGVLARVYILRALENAY